VHTDRRLLRRALQNFLANALRYTRTGGVLMTARVRDGAVALQVWDTGPGISEHHLDQIFEEFRRFETPGSSGERGLGLGLSICQRIARTLDHPLGVRSRVGHGSMFAITVPFGRAQFTVPQDDSGRSEMPRDSLAGLRVLCVDNDREILDGMRALLSRWEVRVLVAADVDEALAQFEANHMDSGSAHSGPPDVMLVDYHLHDRLDGLGLIDLLRERIGRDIPAALLTGDGSDAVKLAARERGCVVLTKPVKPASLRALLASVRQVVAVG
jgi:CheY-like chemotaxis protein/anti-sigma regulatory factor (Ser/Thr protein kinase)